MREKRWRRRGVRMGRRRRRGWRWGKGRMGRRSVKTLE